MAVLYEDLTGRAARIIGCRNFRRAKEFLLGARKPCLCCDYLAQAGHGAPWLEAHRRRIEAADRTRAWVRGTAAIWGARCCPECLPESARGAAAIRCRNHLQPRDLRRRSAHADYLAELAARLGRCRKSMTANGHPHDTDSDAALVEAVGFFAGWTPLRAYSGERPRAGADGQTR